MKPRNLACLGLLVPSALVAQVVGPAATEPADPDTVVRSPFVIDVLILSTRVGVQPAMYQ